MGAFSRAKQEFIGLHLVGDEAIAPAIAPDEVVADEFAPGPKRLIESETISDEEIRKLDEISRSAGYRVDGRTQTDTEQGARAVHVMVEPSVDAKTASMPRRRLRRRLVNIPQEPITLRVATSTLDAFDEWCDGLALTKKAGFIEMVTRITRRARHADSEDEHSDQALISGAGEGDDGIIRGQMPRHLARRHSVEAEEPVTFYVPCQTIEAFEAWNGDRSLTKKAGFAEMVRRVTRSR